MRWKKGTSVEIYYDKTNIFAIIIVMQPLKIFQGTIKCFMINALEIMVFLIVQRVNGMAI